MHLKRKSKRPCRSPLARKWLWLLLLLHGICTDPAGAQRFRMGVAEALPKPMTSLDMQRLSSMMRLTSEQIRAWTSMHEDYKAGWKRLGENDGVFASFTAARTSVDGIPYRAQPARAEMERWLSAHQAAQREIAGLDNRLFDDLLPLISDEQKPAAERARLLRERARLTGDELIREWLNPATTTDLSVIFMAFEAANADALADDQRAASWAVLDAHQSQYVSRLRDLQERARGMHREWLSTLEKDGVPPNAVDLSDQENLDREMYHKVSRAWHGVTRPIKPEFTELNQAMRAAIENVAHTLPPAAAFRWRCDVFDKAYPETVGNLRSAASRMRDAIGISTLTADQRAALQALETRMIESAVTLMNALADAMGQKHTKEAPSYNADQRDDFDRMLAARVRLHEEANAIEAAIVEVVGAEALRAHYTKDRDARLREMFRMAGAAEEEIDGRIAEFQREGQAFIGPRDTPDIPFAPPIAMTDLQLLLPGGPNEGAPPAADSPLQTVQKLHADYHALYQKIWNETQWSISSLAIGYMHRRDRGEGRVTYASPRDVERAMAMEREGHESLRRLDEALMNDLAAAVAIDARALQRVRQAREWRTFARGARKGPDELRAYEANVSLFAIVDDLGLSQEDQAAADELLGAHAEALLLAARAHFDANRSAWHARDMAHAHADGPERSDAAIVEDRQRGATALEAKADAQRSALASAVQTLVAEFADALPVHAAAIRSSYERAAYPQVFKNQAAMDQSLSKALALPDLTQSQGSEIEAAAAGYQPKHRDVCERMIMVNREWDAIAAYAEDGQARRSEARLKWDRLAFERDELDAVLMQTLRRVLTGEQRNAAGVPGD